MSHSILKRVVILVGSLALAPLAQATTTVLYDGTAGTLPSSQGWVTLGTSTQSMVGTVANLDSTASMNIRDGWARFPAMNATTGYTLKFTSAVGNEQNSSNDRSGFDVLMISSDVHKALELAFWSDRVFVLNDDVPTFSHGQEAMLNATVLHDYSLAVQGSSYTLFDGTSSILSGSLRDYSASSATVLGIAVYQQANFLFMGDDTTSAQAITKVQHVELQDTVAPEPASLALAGLGAMGLLMRRAKRRELPANQ